MRRALRDFDGGCCASTVPSDVGCLGQRCRYDHWLDDWDGAVRVHAAAPDGLGRIDPGYLLMTIIAVLLVLGSDEVNARKWNVVGALVAHCAPLIAALSSLDRIQVDGALGIVEGAIAFHIVWLCLETGAALYPGPET